MSKEMHELYRYMTGEELEYDNLNEMSFNRDFVKLVWYQNSFEIIRNWCLISYAAFYREGIDKININHWKSELKEHIRKSMEADIKNNNSKKSRKKLADELWISDLGYNKSSKISKILKIIRKKFSSEYPNFKESDLVHVISVFQKDLDNLINVVVESDDDILDNFVDNLEDRVREHF